MSSPVEFPLWPSTPPGARGSDPATDIPTLTYYPPPSDLATGLSIVVSPGGGYWELMDYEGRDFALWLNERGLAAFVLKYRLASAGYHHPAITNDLFRAIRHVRAHAAQWRLDPAKVGVMGSSAGGHLSSLALTLAGQGNPSADDPVERESARPAFGILCYPVISMELMTMKNFLGPSPTAESIRAFSTDLHVTPQTPPCFIWHEREDPTVQVDHALRFAAALSRHGVSFALHIYASARHGAGLGVHGYLPGRGDELHPWTFELDRWLRELVSALPVKPRS